MDGVPNIGERELLQLATDPQRWRILELLAGGPRTVGELVDQLEVAQPGVSHHLGRLRRAGLVRVMPEGRARRYAWAEPAPGTAHSAVRASLRGWISRARGDLAPPPVRRRVPMEVHLL